MSGSASVTCRGLVYIYRLEGYDVVALGGVDLDIAPGESVALLGPSGSGKSTLLSLLAGLIRPAAGRATVSDTDLAKATESELARMRATTVGVVLQGAQRNLLSYLTAEQNVRFAQRGARGHGVTDLPVPRDVLSLVGMGERGKMRQRPAALTPGERQRLALAVALAHRPGLLLADEPTSQLDTRARDEVIASLEAVRRAGTTVIVVTHDPEVGAGMGRQVTIRDGRVGAEGSLGEEFAVVGRDGSVNLPPEVLAMLPPGTRLRVHPRPDGTVLLAPADATPAVPSAGSTSSAVARSAPPSAPAVAAPVSMFEPAPSAAHGHSAVPGHGVAPGLGAALGRASVDAGAVAPAGGVDGAEDGRYRIIPDYSREAGR